LLKVIFLFFILLGSLAADNLSLQDPYLKISELKKELLEIDKKLSSDNIWINKYSNYDSYIRLVDDINEKKGNLKLLERQKRTPDINEAIKEANRQISLLEEQKELLSNFKENPFKELILLDEIKDIPSVENPIVIINAFSFIKQLQQKKDSYQKHGKLLQEAIDGAKKKKDILEHIYELDPAQNYKKELKSVSQMLQELEYAQKIFFTTLSVYNKKVDEVIASLSEQVMVQFKKIVYITVLIFIFFGISVSIKAATKKYITDNERLYTVNKIVNFITFTVILLILLFAYLENVSYLVTVVGFASAGLAIAMKDLFMSILGWLVIIFGGSIHVGDRIRVVKDGMTYVGDVLDVSLLRITIHEDVTLTSYMENRRAGRIIFIPNNYVFTTLLANYSHSSMQTVWDGIDITVTFDSDFKKAAGIVKEITRKYSKGYTEITRKHINMLRDRYSLRSANVDPRIFTFIEPNGVRISAWYLTNSFATLTIRSSISSDIVTEFMKCESIKIAYPTTTIKTEKSEQPAPGELPEANFRGI